jgi:DNA-binding response OmpR family regulator
VSAAVVATLDGRKPRVLVIEDEALVAMLIEEMVAETGSELVGSAHTLRDGIDIARSAPADVALLDLNLRGELAYPVADALRERGIPVVFTTGYGSIRVPERFRNCPLLEKPFNRHSLARALAAVLREGGGPSTGVVALPQPCP